MKTHRDLGIAIVSLVLVWLFDFFGVDSIDAVFMTIIMYAGINVILAVSLNLVTGFTGQFSIGHAGFMAAGAYVSALFTAYVKVAAPEAWASALGSQGLFLLSLILGGAFAAAVGYLVGLPSLRLKGDYLAIVTLGFGEIIRVVLLNMDFAGGARGLPGIDPLSSFGWVYTFVIVTVLATTRLIGSSKGRELLAVREDEVAAEAMGIATTNAKVRAFVFGAFFAGIAGGLFAHYLRYISPSIFDFQRSFEIMTMVVLGGMGSITGSIFAAIFLTGLKEYLHKIRELGITTMDLRMIIYSLFLIILMLTRPNGIFGRSEITDLFKRKTRATKKASAKAASSGASV